ncbi:hypothetical protein [Pararhizobium sp. IMCC21322]|uniref:hypothetical protein n=1 Tax=Pararhizobium sp. IMCC21322 TaxID=3067903 RepID=UPI002740E20D|nr:hypothetical protein [Pararhizobium sp. IMCC21322]
MAFAARTVETESFSLKSQSVPSSDVEGTIPDNANDAEAPPRISYDMTLLPQAVQQIHATLLTAARNGNLAALTAIIVANGKIPVVAFEEVEDPVLYLRELSGDEEGQEILAIMLEVLEAGYAQIDAGTDAEIYVWPYFANIRIDTLTPQQRVELFTLVTAGDYEDMKVFGAYNFFRLGISPDGVWQFFLAGD